MTDNPSPMLLGAKAALIVQQVDNKFAEMDKLDKAIAQFHRIRSAPTVEEFRGK